MSDNEKIDINYKKCKDCEFVDYLFASNSEAYIRCKVQNAIAPMGRCVKDV